ncbi:MULTISPECIES: hypothetical protein [Achromobacter]|uniref:Uncharacterized protein n=2 Tax=Achromobacter denitrificans TaxID=32002 RepID=A0A6N0JJU1_ACHDE|nr:MULTISPECIES: hypothetical protein [Achromobacter]MDF3858219.1 hypothetical protein [Achromobacter denitrificans]MDF3938563.1 hypothetical protein [Achromobacter denitrificans]QKQ47401.1 hypothetical protein FOC81_12115 [Achromobacter denitrificans]
MHAVLCLLCFYTVKHLGEKRHRAGMTEHDGHPDVRQPSGSSGASELRREQPAHEGKRLLALEASLFDNELLLLCYLVQEPAERDAIMVKLMNDAGLAGGRKKARAWFFEKAQALAAALGVDKIERY